ncbi:hypothetical protein LY76DRAFT_248669 [Colletotrichum caudatum]|nr:hypothetical protein LY76DRAFT_248669 [Colletotrichum caudatum]
MRSSTRFFSRLYIHPCLLLTISLETVASHRIWVFLFPATGQGELPSGWSMQTAGICRPYRGRLRRGRMAGYTVRDQKRRHLVRWEEKKFARLIFGLASGE